MGRVEEIFVLREDYPIAHIEYKGFIMGAKLKKYNLMGNDDIHKCRITGDDFNKILKDFQEEMINEQMKHFVWYFEDLSILPTDIIVFEGL